MLPNHMKADWFLMDSYDRQRVRYASLPILVDVLGETKLRTAERDNEELSPEQRA